MNESTCTSCATQHALGNEYMAEYVYHTVVTMLKWVISDLVYYVSYVFGYVHHPQTSYFGERVHTVSLACNAVLVVLLYCAETGDSNHVWLSKANRSAEE